MENTSIATFSSQMTHDAHVALCKVKLFPFRCGANLPRKTYMSLRMHIATASLPICERRKM